MCRRQWDGYHLTVHLPGIEMTEGLICGHYLITATMSVKAYSGAIGWTPGQAQAVAEMEEFLKHVVVKAVAKAKGLTDEMLAPEIADSRNESAAREYKPSTSRLSRY
jgi:hypothetical protein